MFRGGILAVFVAILLLFSLHAGYTLGSNADNMSEIESELAEIDTEYEETKEQNLSIQESDLEGRSKLETEYYRAVVRPAYQFGHILLDVSENTIRVSARFSYRYL